MTTTTAQPLSADDALALHLYDDIVVHVGGHKRAQAAVVTGAPSRVGQWVLVPYSLVHTGAQFDGSLRSGYHVATLGGSLTDKVWRR